MSAPLWLLMIWASMFPRGSAAWTTAPQINMHVYWFVYSRQWYRTVLTAMTVQQEFASIPHQIIKTFWTVRACFKIKQPTADNIIHQRDLCIFVVLDAHLNVPFYLLIKIKNILQTWDTAYTIIETNLWHCNRAWGSLYFQPYN